MSDALVVGIIADTGNPGAAARLIGDLARLAEVDPGLARVEVILVENPSVEGVGGATQMPQLDAGLLEIERVGRGRQERDAARGRFGRVELPSGRLPIAVARTIVQRYASERGAGRRAAVWILDEDMRLSPLLDAASGGEPPLSEAIRRLREERVDVAVGSTLGAPPLPARSTVRVNLEDVLRHLDVVDALDPEEVWPDRASENARVRSAFPEYYYDLSRVHEDAGAQPMWLEDGGTPETVRSAFARLSEGVGGLASGVPVTRGIPETRTLSAAQSPLARGGNTLVLRPDLLAHIPNVALRVGGRVCRRSDMIWVRLAVAVEGARVARAPIAALHDRSGLCCSTFDVDKLLDDVRGSALVCALDALIEDGDLSARRPPAPASLARASAIYVARARERLSLISRSEARVRSLLDGIVSRVRTGTGHLRHPAHATAVGRLLDHVARLHTAHDPGVGPFDPAGEQPEVERFFRDLPDEIDAYRAGAHPTTRCVSDAVVPAGSMAHT